MADLQRALEIAVESHKGQTQKNGLPYVLHPLALMQPMTSLETRIAAVLHDVIEDSDWELSALASEGFSAEVIEALRCLTHDSSEDYEHYIERIANNPIARTVKLADLKDNMNMRRIPDLKEKDLTRIARYHKAWIRLEGEIN